MQPLENDPTLRAIQDIVQADLKLQLDLDNPETQLQHVLSLMEVATTLTARVTIKHRAAKSAREHNDALTRRSLIANNVGPKMTEQQLSDAIATNPNCNLLLSAEQAYETAFKNIRSYMDLYDSYRETLFRLVSLKSATTRNIQ